jgi:hypothetical protein
LGPLKDIENTWLIQTGKEKESGVHSKSKRSEDISTMVKVLVKEANVCSEIDGRKRCSEKKYRSYMHKERKATINKWLKRTCKEVTLI